MKWLRENRGKEVDKGVIFVDIDSAHDNQKIDISSK